MPRYRFFRTSLSRCGLISATVLLSLTICADQADARRKRGPDGPPGDPVFVDPAYVDTGNSRMLQSDPSEDRPTGRRAGNAKGVETGGSYLPTAPKGPVTLVVSTDQQILTVYDGDTQVGQTPVSTGVPAHPTPHGVFSVIQKQRFHRSNIYSNAPMPFMQRLTWSGIALHQGHVTGAVASHGCIRLPGGFAQALFRYTREGARVIIARENVYSSNVYGLQPFTAPATAGGMAASFAVSTDSAAMPNTAIDHRDGAAKAADMQQAENAASPAFQAPPVVQVPPVIEASQTPSVPAKTIKPGLQKNPNNAAPITALVNRRTGKLYVRRALQPIFEVPITIDQPEKPLGLHLFVARKMDVSGHEQSALMQKASLREKAPEGKVRQEGLAWSVYTLATPTPVRRRAKEGEASIDLSDYKDISASASLQRIHIAPGTLARLGAILTPGAALILSDGGALGKEDWNGTNFIALTQ